MSELNVNLDPGLTVARLEALNAVDVQLIGVTHGFIQYVEGIPHVKGGNPDDFDRLMTVANTLRVERGDRLAVEPIGFMSAKAENMTLASILPADIPDVPVSDMPSDLKEGVIEFLERGRSDFYLSNLAYVAAHTLLRGVPVETAEVSSEDWGAFQKLLPEFAPSAAQDEVSLFYRNTKMIARLGDMAIDMTASRTEQTDSASDAVKPILLFASGRTHTLRIAERFVGSVSFTVDI